MPCASGSSQQPQTGGMTADYSLLRTKTVVVNSGSAADKRVEIERYFTQTFDLYEKLFDVVSSPKGYFVKAEPLRHPLIFYLGHTACFFVNKFILGKYITQRIDPELETMCAVGVDEMSWDDLDETHYAWPTEKEAHEDPQAAALFVERVLQYRQKVRSLVVEMIRTYEPLEVPITKDSFWWIVLMGIEHERIHLETSSVIIRRLPTSLVRDHPLWSLCPHGAFGAHPDQVDTPHNKLIDVAGGEVVLGRAWDASNRLYGWDNEFGHRKTTVADFKASQFLVSNKEYLEFMQDGGYTTQKYWTAEGWQWVQDMQVTKPLFWIPPTDTHTNVAWRLRCLTSEIEMPWDWPVEVNNLEAKAFCNWKAHKMSGAPIRLPSEEEWHLMRRLVVPLGEDQPDWKRAPGNVNLEHWASSCPVSTFKQTDSGLYDVVGNVWQHTETPVDVFDGFAVHPLYDDFTTPTIDGKHNLIKGGSWISTGNEATTDSRYAFRRHFYQHAGIRYVESAAVVKTTVCPFETDKLTADTIAFHYQPHPWTKADSFPTLLAEECVSAVKAVGIPLHMSKALEFGCGAGRTTFELAHKFFDTVHGADLTARYFQVADRFMTNGRIRYAIQTEGDLVEYPPEIVAKDFAFHQAIDDPHKKIQFHQADVANLDINKFNEYDLVVMASPGFIESLSKPKTALQAIHKHINPGGLLVIGYTGKPPTHKTEECIGGYLSASGRQVSIEEGLTALLSPHFDAVAELPATELPYCVRDTARKTEVGWVRLTYWRRKQDDDQLAGGGVVLPEPLLETEKEKQGGPEGMYETPQMVNVYLDMHFSTDVFNGVSNYPARCAALCGQLFRQHGPLVVPLTDTRCLEVGGGVGRATMELSKHFHQVVGSDYSQAFAAAGSQVVREGRVEWRVATEGRLTERREVTFDQLGLTDKSIADRVSFRRLDAMALPSAEAMGGKFHLIFGGNLLCRLPDPSKFLTTVHQLLEPGGLLVFTSPWTWLESVTPKELWIGGFKKDGEDYTSLEGLRDILSSSRKGRLPGGKASNRFTEVVPAEREVPFVIRECSRVFQRTSAMLTVWRFDG
ncbi:unnamed protein product [Vitrella brassicaformis CCMP3155]|uniref:Uncharacterized protein n=1 Tax=Vitrella brassicaformis (strain CCMP3155) TaxID=1169540 RepID=A0A0G4EH92_VITBC|nr:unnamed protein product [Vitrella brassicaformis CCMP3155]|mmetsp:Transcript_37604/g.94327  ORF Transcript_37604/g.94327 Transcript_37604/m.94327 type:complete len:1073 (-) Transcript_37604:1018-4236(-)|eukprot:CEL95347.1 unnamed protein product [Vitrella brassicaformis CCMP3155]